MPDWQPASGSQGTTGCTLSAVSCLEPAGDHAAARAAYLEAAELTTNLPQQRYLHARAARLTTGQ